MKNYKMSIEKLFWKDYVSFNQEIRYDVDNKESVIILRREGRFTVNYGFQKIDVDVFMDKKTLEKRIIYALKETAKEKDSLEASYLLASKRLLPANHSIQGFLGCENVLYNGIIPYKKVGEDKFLYGCMFYPERIFKVH